MVNEIIDTLDAIETQINDLVTVIEMLRDIETDEDAFAEDVSNVKKKLEGGIISKSSFDKIFSKSQSKLTELRDKKKENWDLLISNLNSITDLLSKIKEKYSSD